MENKLFGIFDKIHAEEELKKRTTDYLYAEIGRRRHRKMRYAVALASLMLFLVCGGLSWKVYFTPVAYIDIDVNPSIELTLNRFGRVIQSDAYNEDGTRLLSGVNLRHADYSEAFERLLVAMNGEGYFAGQDSLLCVTVQTNGKNRENRIQESLRRAVAFISRSQHCDISTEIFGVSEEVKHCADENHISPAKYLAIQELMEVDSEADFEDCRERSVHELRQQAEEHCRNHHGEENGNQGSENQGSGNQGNGNQGNGNQGNGNQGSGNQGNGDQENGSQGSGMTESGTQGNGTRESGTQSSETQESGTQGGGNHSHGHGHGRRHR